MQVLKFQDQTYFLAGTEFIVGKNIDLPLTELPRVPITMVTAMGLQTIQWKEPRKQYTAWCIGKPKYHKSKYFIVIEIYALHFLLDN